MKKAQETPDSDELTFSFEELAQTEEYWLTNIQCDLYARVEEYRETNGWNRSQLAAHLGVSKGYISQVLNGDFDHKLSSLVRLALAVGVVPNLKFQPVAEYVENFTSGYDFCINDAAVSATITVSLPAVHHYDVSHVGRASMAYHPHDEETYITYRPSSKQPLTRRTPVYG